MKRLAILVTFVFAMAMAMPAAVSGKGKPSFPLGQVLTGGAFWAGSTNIIGASWVATDPVIYGNDYEGGSGVYEAGNSYGSNIHDFSIDGASTSTVILKGSVTLHNIGVWPLTSYFEIGLGGSINGWHQYFGEQDGCVYIIFFGNADGGYDIHIQDYIGHRPAETAIYSTTGTAGQDPVLPATFHFMAEFDLDNQEAYLTINGVSVDPVPFGTLAMGSGTEFFDVGLGVFAGVLSVDTDNTGYATISALKVTVE